ncbi:hypothetical protein MOO46_05290 [Apilactobacillus apisilvae]|uniref:Uncharacterized protein n=1 Tax=Apilactobacillus apisilvae TaxID=2923364 RepID=A0ABY4PFV3_9LACO|nr:hypothetical protein [Apilactobacillus apisilvae]UQS84665.1 hypothetical protein MOO46_05290 [Apilactobacillus apisilvae]
MNKNIKTILYSLIATFTVTTAIGSINANANTKKYNHFDKAETSAKTITKNQNWADRLNKHGYTFRIQKHQMDSFSGEFTRNLNRKKPSNYSLKDVEKFADSNMNFRVNHIWSYKNGLEANVVSQSGKVSGWIQYNSLYNKEQANKSLKPLIKIENRIADKAEDVTFYQYEGKKIHENKINKAKASINNDLKQAQTEANKLTGNNKKLADKSIKEAKVFAKNSDIKNLPALLVGRM